MKAKTIHSGLFGLAVGDALGVPVEFLNRSYFDQKPVTGMMAYGTHHQPAGTWSDDSSLAFCLAESLCEGYDLKDMARKFLQWSNAEIHTPYGEVFDIGLATKRAMYNIAGGKSPVLCGGFEEHDNGNGSLMRILPLAFYLKDANDLDVIFQKTKEVSSITHAHFRSVFCCFIYIVYALELINGKNKNEAYEAMQKKILEFIDKNNFNPTEICLFDRILTTEISHYPIDGIYSSGYVLHSLEASFWCLLNTDSYEESVLKAVNLGEDTDTTAAITGGISGLLYGFEGIPEGWKSQLARQQHILDLCNLLEMRLRRIQIH